jgi:asparagine synthase (glutamine-hydrolysing)
MTVVLEAEFAGVHDPRGGVDAESLHRAMPGAEVVESGAFALACRSPGWANGTCAAIAGRLQRAHAVRNEVGCDGTVEEVVATGYARWGSVLLDRLRGPFALVAWNADTQRGVLAQDQLGGRSIFTYLDGSRLLFATEVVPLLRLLRRRPGPDDVALAYHLVDHSVPDDRTLFDGIRRVGGGRHLELSPSGHVRRRHWTPQYRPLLQSSRVELAEQLRETLSTAIHDALTPLPDTAAMLLSGGLDSSAVASLVSRSGFALEAFSACFPDDPQLDETHWAGQLADHIGVPLTTVSIERREPLHAAARYLDAWQLPLPVPGIVIDEQLLATARSHGATVAIDGQGGDELFGASHFLISDYLRRLRLPAAWRLARRNPWGGSTAPRRQVWRLLIQVGARGALPPRLHELTRRRRPAERYAPRWLRPGLVRLYHETEDPWRWKRQDGPRWWAWLADTLTRGRETADIANYLRRRAHLGGLETLSPLLDVSLVELMLRVPPEVNFDPFVTRPLVREALRGTLPPSILARRDKGDFSALQHRTLLAAENLREIRLLLDERTAEVGAYVDLRRFRQAYLDRPPAVGEPDWRVWAIHVWNVVTAETWLREQASRRETLAVHAQRA